MLLLPLVVLAHDFEDVAAVAALEFIDRHVLVLHAASGSTLPAYANRLTLRSDLRPWTVMNGEDAIFLQLELEDGGASH